MFSKPAVSQSIDRLTTAAPSPTKYELSQAWQALPPNETQLLTVLAASAKVADTGWCVQLQNSNFLKQLLDLK